MAPELDGAPRPPAGGWMDDYLTTVTAPPASASPSLPGLLGPVTSTGIPPMTSGDGFLVDPEKARAAIGRLEKLARTLQVELHAFRNTSRFGQAPTLDGVGQQAVENASRMSDNAAAFVLAVSDQIAATVAALEAQLAAYQRVDRTTASKA